MGAGFYHTLLGGLTRKQTAGVPKKNKTHPSIVTTPPTTRVSTVTAIPGPCMLQNLQMWGVHIIPVLVQRAREQDLALHALKSTRVFQLGGYLISPCVIVGVTVLSLSVSALVTTECTLVRPGFSPTLNLCDPHTTFEVRCLRMSSGQTTFRM
jgi:hypothetical protein